MRVALVEDNETIVELLLAVLPKDYEVTLVAPDTLEQQNWDDIDVALVDRFHGSVQSPSVGHRVLSYLAEHAPHVRRILITASANSPEGLPRELTELAHAVYMKPFVLPEVVAEVGRGRAD